jgi:hypothetical protein
VGQLPACSLPTYGKVRTDVRACARVASAAPGGRNRASKVGQQRVLIGVEPGRGPSDPYVGAVGPRPRPMWPCGGRLLTHGDVRPVEPRPEYIEQPQPVTGRKPVGVAEEPQPCPDLERPLTWIPVDRDGDGRPLTWRRRRRAMRCHDRRIRRSSGGRWWSWYGPAGRQKSWPPSSSRRPSRSGTGWPRPTGRKAVASMA